MQYLLYLTICSIKGCRQAGKSVIFSVTCNKFRESILRHKIELEDRAAAPTVTVTRSIVILDRKSVV